MDDLLGGGFSSLPAVPKKELVIALHDFKAEVRLFSWKNNCENLKISLAKYFVSTASLIIIGTE